jgi:excisionase family DNA binding protein
MNVITEANTGQSAQQPHAAGLLSKQEIAAVFGVSQRTVENWIAQKRIPYYRLSTRLIRFSLPRVEAALARYEIKEVRAGR